MEPTEHKALRALKVFREILASRARSDPQALSGRKVLQAPLVRPETPDLRAKPEPQASREHRDLREPRERPDLRVLQARLVLPGRLGLQVPRERMARPYGQDQEHRLTGWASTVTPTLTTPDGTSTAPRLLEYGRPLSH
mgnify:CR=1 FL=1